MYIYICIYIYVYIYIYEVSSSELKSALSSASSANLKNESCGESLWPRKKIDTVGGGGGGGGGGGSSKE